MNRDLEAIPDVPSDEEHDEAAASLLSVRASFSGPLPPPELLKQYDEVVPGAADRIISMAEAEQAHEADMGRRGYRLLHDVLKQREQTYR